MREVVSKLIKLNELFDYAWFTVEIRIMRGKPVYFLVYHYLDGPNTYERHDTLKSLNKWMDSYIHESTE